MKKRVLCVLLSMALVFTSSDFTVAAAEQTAVAESASEEEPEKEEGTGSEEHTEEASPEAETVDQESTKEEQTEKEEATNSVEHETESSSKTAESSDVIEPESNSTEAETETTTNEEVSESVETAEEQTVSSEPSAEEDTEKDETEGYMAAEDETSETENISLSNDATSGKCGDNLTWKLENGTLTISGTGEMWDGASVLWHLVEPTKLVLEEGITKIGDFAFNYWQELLTGDLIIPNSVTSIGENAFYGCNGFTGDLKIGDSVTSIGENAFYGCSGFAGNLIIGDKVTTIGKGAFRGCSGFTGDLIMPDSVKNIEAYAFDDCNGFTGNLILSNNITSIGAGAFNGCSGFTGELIIPDNVTSIGADAFNGCSGFTGELIIPDSVTSIGSFAFNGCSGFTGELIIPDSVTSIEDGTFDGCSGFTGELVIPDSVTNIGEHAFDSCSGFTGELIIPNSVTSIGEFAFDDCSGFTGNLIIPDSVTTSIGTYAFIGCSGFNGSLVIGNGVTSIGHDAFGGCSGFTGDLIIPNSVTSIGGWAFIGCSGFNGNLVIGNGVTSIGMDAFGGCSGFTGDLIIGNSLSKVNNWFSPDSPIFKGNLVIGNNVSSIEDGAFMDLGFTGDLVIPDNVTSIGEWAFCSCDFTGNLIIGDGVTSIGENAFAYCNEFTGDLVIGNGITDISYSWFGYDDDVCKGFKGKLEIGGNVEIIDESVFKGCSGFTGDLVIPAGVKSIGANAFEGCSGFTGTLVIPNSVTSIGGYAFSGCSGFTGTLVIPNSVTAIGSSAFSGCSGFTGTLVIPNSVTSIGEEAFNGCSGFTGTLVIPNSVTSIGEEAFNGCSGFTGTLVIPNSVTAIGSSAFSGCSGFTGNLTIGNGLTGIKDSAFNGCSGFRGKLTLGSGVTSIGNYAFRGCSSLTGNLEIPDQVTFIGTEAFSDCASLTSVKLSGNVKSVGSYAFDGCSSLQELIIPEGVTKLGCCMIKGTAINSIKIPSTVTESGIPSSYEYDGALAGCTSLNEVIFAQGMKTIPAYICASRSQTGSINSVVVPDSVEEIESYAFYGCDSLASIYYGGDAQQWAKISIGTNNSPLTNVLTSQGIHYATTEAEYESITRITLFPSRAAGPFPGDKDFLALNIGLNWDDDDDGKTVTWQSSNPEVFELTRKNSATYHAGELNGEYYSGALYGEVFSEKLTWWHVYGNALSLGKSVITVTASDGASASFEITVTEKPNTVSLSGVNRMEVGGYYPMTVRVTINKQYLASGEKPRVEWTSSDGSILAFDENGSDSVVHTLNNSDNKDVVVVYASSLGKADLSCRLLGSGETSKFKITVYGESVPELEEKINDWKTAYTSYIEAVQGAMEKQKDISDATIEKQAQALREADDAAGNSKLVNFTNTNEDEKVKKYVYQATVRFLEDCAAGSLDLGSLSASTDVTGMATNIVNKIYKAVDTRYYSYKFDGGVTITIKGLSLSGAHQRTVHYSKNGKDEMVASIISTKSQMQGIIESYLNELIKLEKAEINKAYSEMLKCVFGKDLSGLVKDKIQKALSNKYTKAFEKSGVGKVVNALNTGIDYYKYVKNIVTNAKKDPQKLYQDLISMKALKFESTSITDKTVKAAMKRVEKAKEALEKALKEYAETGSVSKETLFGIIASFKCPVSIEIYDSKGTQVGYVGDDDLWYDESIISIERYGDAKTIRSYGETLTFKAVGTDYGMLNCTFEEYTDGEAVNRVNCYDIPLCVGKEILAEIPGQDLTEDSVKITADGTEHISASESIDASDYDKESVHIDYSVNMSEGGQVFGAGEYVRGDAVTVLAETNNGYVFLGWQTDEEAILSLSPVYEFVAREDLLLTALFAQDTSEENDGVILDYTVTFDSDGGTKITPQIIQEYERAIEPVIPVKEGHNFTGWYLDGVLFDFNTGITSDINLKAGWTEMEKLTAPAAGIVSESEVKAGTKLDLTSNEGAYIYYTIDGAEPTRASKRYVNPIVITENVTIKAFAVKDGYLDSDVAVFTYLVSAVYTVTFDSSGGTNVEAQIIKEGEKVLVPSPPAKEGFVFTGWYLNGALYDFNTPVTGDLTLEAGWAEIGTVTAPSPGIASGSAVKSGTKLELVSDEGAKIYYTVDGTDPTESSTLYTEPIVIINDITIKAFAVKEGFKNSEIKSFTYTISTGFTVAFNSNGGSSVEPQIIQENGKATEPPVPVREGYRFTGWYLGGVLFDFNTLVSSDITLEAGWIKADAPDDTEGVLPDDIPESGIPDGLWIAGVNDVTYTGKAVKPSVRVYDGTVRLVEKRDYTISYKNNINANDASNERRAPSVIIKAKGNYSGRETATFKILPKDINSAGFDAADVAAMPNGKVQKPVPVLTYNGKKLANKKDFTLAYPDTSGGAYKEKGAYTVKITGKGNYAGERTVNFTITDLHLVSRAKTSKISSQQYTGNALTPSVTVKYGKTVLSEGTDYELEYRNNTEIGTANIVIKGIGAYCGQKSVPFRITGTAISKAKVSGLDTPSIYSGNEIAKDCSLTISVNGSQRTLKEGQDYTLAFQNNKNSGKATAVFTGINGYTGTLKKTFKITAYDIQTDTDKKITHGQKLSVPYAKNGCCPDPVIYFGGEKLVKGRDYQLSYKYNKAVTDGNNSGKMPTIVARGKGNFKGTVSIPFTITVQDIGNLTLTAKDRAYKNRANIFATSVTVTDINGKALKSGKDYDKSSIAYTYVNDVTLENGGSKKAGDSVGKTDVIPADTQIQVTVNAKTGGCYTGTAKGIYRIIKSDIKNAKVSVPAQTYTGKSIVPAKSDITVTVGRTKLAESEFEIVSCTNNIKKGKASLTIKGTGNYGGTKTVKFTIRSKGFLWWWRK